MNLNTNIRQDQYSQAPDQANARGAQEQAQQQQRIAGAYANASQARTQQMIQELRQAAESHNQVAKNVQEIGRIEQTVAQEVGKNNAQSDIKKHKDDIRAVRASDLTPEEKAKKIDELNLKTASAWGGVYSKAYNNSIEANYVNESVLRAYEIADQAEKAAKENPEDFKKAYNKYLGEFLKGAPSDAARIAVEDIFSKQGERTYKNIYTQAKAKMDLEHKQNASRALELLQRQYHDAQQRGIDGADELVRINEQIQANIDSRVASGLMTKAKAKETKEEIQNNQHQQSLSVGFAQAYQQGQGITFLEKFKEDKAKGLYKFWKPGAYDRMKADMESSLKIQANEILDDAYTKVKNNKILSEEEEKQVNTFIQYTNKETQEKYFTEKAAQKFVRGFDKPATENKEAEFVPLPKQENIILQQIQKTDDPEVLKVLNKSLQIVKDKRKLSKDNNLLLAKNEGLVLLNPIDADSPPEMIQQRYIKAQAAKNKYKGNLTVFLPEEQKAIEDSLSDPYRTTKDKLQIVRNIVKGTNGDAQAFFSKSKDPVYRGVANMISNLPKDPVVQQEQENKIGYILQGKGSLKAGTSIVTKQDTKKAILESDYATVFIGMTEAGKASFLDTTQAYIAGKYEQRVDEEGKKAKVLKDPSTYQDYVDYIKELHGEAATYNGFTYFPRPGDDPKKIQDFLEDIDDVPLEPMMDPQTKGKEAEVIKYGRIYRTPKGYGVITKNGRIVQTPDGEPYVIDPFRLDPKETSDLELISI